MIEFEVRGIPKTKGSISSVPYKKKNTGTWGVRSFNSCKTEKAWARLVEFEARKHAPDRPISGPVCLQVEFRMKPPKKWQGELYHTKRPDKDKLIRSLKDALKKGGIYKDDSQVCNTTERKIYHTQTGATVKVWDMTGRYPAVFVDVWE